MSRYQACLSDALLNPDCLRTVTTLPCRCSWRGAPRALASQRMLCILMRTTSDQSLACRT